MNYSQHSNNKNSLGEKLTQVIQLLREIDCEIDNEICLQASVLVDDYDDAPDEFSFWGIADIIECYGCKINWGKQLPLTFRRITSNKFQKIKN